MFRVKDSDVTVRISASRLRDSLDEYFRKESQPDEIRIHMPPRSYYIAAEQPARAGRPQPHSIGQGYEVHPAATKKISESDIIGELGINLIQKLCLEMGFLWHPTGLEAGIDGYIEIRLETGEVTNCIIQVQSKATDRPFEAETHRALNSAARRKDLDYWLAGNAPVILSAVPPKNKRSILGIAERLLQDIARRKTAKIVFDKTRDRFDLTAKPALQRLANPSRSGLYLGTHPKQEVVYSNLL